MTCDSRGWDCCFPFFSFCPDARNRSREHKDPPDLPAHQGPLVRRDQPVHKARQDRKGKPVWLVLWAHRVLLVLPVPSGQLARKGSPDLPVVADPLGLLGLGEKLVRKGQLVPLDRKESAVRRGLQGRLERRVLMEPLVHPVLLVHPGHKVRRGLRAQRHSLHL